MKLHVINTGFFRLDGGAMFGVVPKTIWNKLNPADDLNLCNWAARCLLIEDGDRRILVDTGLGDKQDAKFWSHYYLNGDDNLQQSLLNAGCTADAITDVLLTHLHFDHCGGAISRRGGALVPTFPNATYWVSEAHWKWATAPNPREKASFLKENILPIQESGQLKFVVAGKAPFSSNIELRNFEGHTRSMILPLIQYKGRCVVFMADLIPSTAHLPIPYVISYDMFPMTTINEKTDFLNEALNNNFVLFFEHDPQHECCDLQQTEKGIRMKSTFSLSEV